ncbi:1013_t:CDS:2 [Entrophospora sp. SA101]|nr:1013_t:CDS:2 [Entrophospora sp. SA101]CAJ0824746.1 3403_t:CDS:2 [Entrophospora sp. SA101]
MENFQSDHDNPGWEQTFTTDISPSDPPVENSKTESFSSDRYSWPILFTLIPPICALISGEPNIWIPWELYYAARTRHVINENIIQEQTFDATQQAIRNQAAEKLRRQELCALIFIMLTPIIGGYILYGANVYLTNYNNYISHFNITLFVFTTAIRPLMHIAKLAKNKTLHLQEQIHYPNVEVELLKRHVKHLEYKLSQIRKILATKHDIIIVKDEFEPTISQLDKAVKCYKEKEQYLRTYSEEKFAYLESKLTEYDNFINNKLQSEKQRSMLALAYRMICLIFIPLNIIFAILGYAKYLLPRFLRNGRQKPMLQPAIISSDNKKSTDEQDSSISGESL